MMVEAATWDDWSTSETRVIEDEDKWHVALAPGEVKVLSLEQLDDLFRLSIVDADTKVWQNGMSEWQPLGVIAGIESPVLPERPRPPPPRSAAPPPPPAPLPQPAAPVSRAPVAAYAQPLAVTPFYAPPAHAAPLASMAPIASVRPLTVSQPPRSARGGGGFGRFLFGVALLAGVSVTAYRNGLVREAAHAIHRDAQYVRLEAALGGPSFGTLRAVEQSTAVRGQNGAEDARPAAAAAAPVTDAASDSVVNATRPRPTEQPVAPTADRAAPASTAVVSLESLAHEGATAKTLPVPVQAGPVVHPARQSKAAAVEKPPLVSRKPDSQMSDRERLDAAIGQSVQSAAKRSNKAPAKAKSSEYDPLNPNL